VVVAEVGDPGLLPFLGQPQGSLKSVRGTRAPHR
jgi:hypothetical protein